jgi:Nucleotidyl transferase AbiEii toxin, Type IV TA system
MAERPLKNIPASVHRRLLNLARETNRPFNEVLQYFAIERFLFRFSRSSYANQFVLKGAQMLQAWNAPLARPTMDIDMLGRVLNSPENLESIIRDCAGVEVEPDGIEFVPASVTSEVIVKDREYQGVRLRVRGLLGKIKLTVQLDFGFGDVVVPEPIWIELPDLLGLGAPRLLGYTPESAIAEKFQAMVALDIANTRIKDFYDIWALSRTLEFEGAVLARAIEATFNQRSTPLPTEAPRALTEEFSLAADKQTLWRAFLRKGRLEADDKQLGEVVTELRKFLMPPTIAAATAESFKKKWRPSGWN